MGFIDLHTHSTASDGTFTPAGLVRAAAEQGLAAVALTDHDTIAGNEEAMAAGRVHGVEVIPGIELSVEAGSQSMHILGLWVPPGATGLTETLAFLRARRLERNGQILDRLRRLGLAVSAGEVAVFSGGGAPGRPHIAQVLVGKGYVSSMAEAFAVYLGSRGSAYVPKVKLGPEQAIPLLKAEGATVVLAHPFLLGWTTSQLEYRARELMAHGLDGIEAHYTEHSAQQTQGYLRLAARLGLAVRGGSDFHGAIKPRIALGTGKGGLHVPLSVLDRLKERRASQGLPV
jgi:predicted metal-dependent phosphoesterase TrpH